jgi:hypothetical protein
MTATTAGFTVTVRGRRIYLVDAEPPRDPGMSHHEARELAQRLLCAAHAAERAARPEPTASGQPPREVAQVTATRRARPPQEVQP